MDIVFYLVVAAVVVIWLLFQIGSKKVAPASAPVPTKPSTIYVPPTADEIMAQLQEHEARFLKDILDKYPARVERHFYVNLAGTSHRNPDRTSRTAAIAKCDRGEELWLEHQAENKYDSNAIAVYSLDVDRQLGYLPARLAGETVRASQRGYSHALYFAHKNLEPETDRVVGATCLYLRLIPPPTGDLIVDEKKDSTRDQPPAPCA
jgi:HIRAN domain-containing protein